MQNEIVEFEAITKVKYDEGNATHKLIVDLMAQENKVRQGNEGITSISLNGISEAYKDGYSKRVYDLLHTIKTNVRFL